MDDRMCVNRAITIGLRAVGIKDDTSWIPGEVLNRDVPKLLEELTQRYPWMIWLGRCGREEKELTNEPGVYFYHYQRNGEPRGHVVFMSDHLPLVAPGIEIVYTIIGFKDRIKQYSEPDSREEEG
jgi:hypothetical protein